MGALSSSSALSRASFSGLGIFYLLHTVCILIYLLFVKLCVPQLQVYDEAATFAQFAFHTDGAVMELHDTLRQCQADTRTRLACIRRVHLVYLVEAVEYLVHFPGIYAAAGIGYADDGIAASVLMLRVMLSSALVCLTALDSRLFITFCICFWSYHTSRLSVSFSK